MNFCQSNDAGNSMKTAPVRLIVRGWVGRGGSTSAGIVVWTPMLAVVGADGPVAARVTVWTTSLAVVGDVGGDGSVAAGGMV